MPLEKEADEKQSAAIMLMKKRLSGFETVKGRLRGLAYQPRPLDVGISTTPKAGTTWMQQICHQIRCARKPDQALDFEEISAVVPWVEVAFDQGLDLEADQPPNGDDCNNLPRLFKTHCWYKHCPPFPKTIVVFRDPCDVVKSFYHFFEDWFFEAGTVDLDTFANEFWLGRGVPDDQMQNASYFVHLISWYEQWKRNESSVLIVFFEDLKTDLEQQVRRVARFLSNENHNFETDAVIKHTVHHSSFAFMKEHEQLFDERLSKRTRNEACGMSKDAGMSKTKINTGQVGKAASEMSDELKSKIQQTWTEVVYPVTQCATYEDLRKQLSSSHQK